MRMIFMGLLLGVAAFVMPSGNGLQAGAWDTAHMLDKPEDTVGTVLLTSNYATPRLLADLAKRETRVPYVLLPDAKGGKIFLCVAKGPAIEIREDDYARLFSYLNPKRVVIIGDSRIVPESYKAPIDSKMEVVKIDSDNWYTNAVTLSNLLESPAILKGYEKLAKKLADGELYKRRAVEAPAAKEEPVETSPDAEPEIKELAEETVEADAMDAKTGEKVEIVKEVIVIESENVPKEPELVKPDGDGKSIK